jgi:hypothetical protein
MLTAALPYLFRNGLEVIYRVVSGDVMKVTSSPQQRRGLEDTRSFGVAAA